LEDGNDAVTKNGDKCTLILTEGDSAKALAVAGLGVIGRDRYGVFPLRGKLLNVRDATYSQTVENKEVQVLDLNIYKQEQAAVHTPIQQPENNDLLDLPQSLQQLNDLIGQGYIRGIQQTLTQCRQNFPEHNELWEQLEHAIQKFDLKHAQRLIQDK
jgi:hypothetical protein